MIKNKDCTAVQLNCFIHYEEDQLRDMGPGTISPMRENLDQTIFNHLKGY